MNNTTSLTKLHREMVAVTEERDRLAAELARLQPFCTRCGGQGVVQVMSDGGPDAYEIDVSCPHCGGDCVEPVAVPAPSVPEEWWEVMAKLVGIVESSTKFYGCDEVTKQARALLQSAEGRCSQTRNEVRHD